MYRQKDQTKCYVLLDIRQDVTTKPPQPSPEYWDFSEQNPHDTKT
jgi:hypothetical protein